MPMRLVGMIFNFSFEVIMFTEKDSKAGFSIVEVMVVVMIIGLLTTLAGNRVLAMIARARQAEARTNLSQIHQLQGTYQLHADNYAEWKLGATTAIGYVGVDTGGDSGRKCTIATANTADGVGVTKDKDGAHDLGWKPKGCSEMRYGYAVLVGSDSNGKERFLAIAFGSSNTAGRVFPTCDGAKRGAAADIEHPDDSSIKQTMTKILGMKTANDGDLMGVTDEKEWLHDDIIEHCD